MLKVVINKCYGGFSLSFKAIERFYQLKFPDKKLYIYQWNDGEIYYKVDKSKVDEWSSCILTHDFGESFVVDKSNQKLFDESYISTYEIKRSDPILVQVVEELGEEANGSCADLKVVTIDSNKYRICEYDGMEWVETPESIEWETA